MKLWIHTTLAAGAVLLAGATLGAQAIINGAGATFPNPIYQKWFSEYNKLHSDVRINYQPVGSGGGIQQVTARTVFFGASDQPMTPEQLQAAPGKLLHFPTVLGGVVPIYNIPGVSEELKFTGPVLADIFLGKVTKWNDPAIAKTNEGVKLPATDIVVVHRSEGSGTTYILADFLGKVSPEWKSKVGVNASLNWPTGIGAKGSDGVTGQVKQTPGAIGYTELTYALTNKISYGSVQNRAGKFVKASPESVSAAAAAAASKMPADFRVSITNADGDAVYPLSSFTWFLLYENPQDKAKAKVMVEFLKWALQDGQKFAPEMGYAPVPKAVVDLELKSLATIKTQ
jgi:phosphate transport system substrate-binding protein